MVAYKPLGCWKDEVRRALPLLEGTSKHLNVHYKRRTNEVAQCGLAALEKGLSTFAVQDGGQCFGLRGATADSYQKYGKSSYCDSDGTGGPMANNVYRFGMFSFKHFISYANIINIHQQLQIMNDKILI